MYFLISVFHFAGKFPSLFDETTLFVYQQINPVIIRSEFFDKKFFKQLKTPVIEHYTLDAISF
jgi:hypothetical protein